MRFVFPSNYFNLRQADEAYSAEYDCLQNLGFETSVVSLESLGSGAAKITPIPNPESRAIYRGWMLSANDYLQLINAMRSTGVEMWISPDEYLATHHLPNWYPLISDLTPETHFLNVDEDLESELHRLGWSRFFIKDHVKSLKTSIGSIISHPSEISIVVAEMKKFRGTIEGGICVRKIEDFIIETEQRYFVINGRSFAAKSDAKVPDIVKDCARRIKSKFFAVDTIERRDGCLRIVEIGDGQVSGLVGWTVDRFASLWTESVEP
jgi:ATP-grasp domain, R2K clade family 3